MNLLLKLEELALMLLGIWGFSTLNYSWWWFAGLFFVPDLGMIGYVVNNQIGALFYNIFHHKGLAILMFMAGIFILSEAMQLAGIILFTHSSFDRAVGYGLKYEKGFKFTHLREIGK